MFGKIFCVVDISFNTDNIQYFQINFLKKILWRIFDWFACVNWQICQLLLQNSINCETLSPAYIASEFGQENITPK